MSDLTAPGLDVRDHVTALRELIDATLAPHRTWGYEDLPRRSNSTQGQQEVDEDLPAIFALVSVERIHAATPRMNGVHSRSGWRASIRWAGRTEPEARWAELRVARAVEGARVRVGDHHSTRIAFETSDAADDDGGRMVGLTSYTYVL